MGAWPYGYLVDYEDDVQAALDKLRRWVFESGQFNGAQFNPSTPEEALEMAGADGTRSILDIVSVSDTPQFGCAAPLTQEELQEFFGTEKPTPKMIEENVEFWESLDRGMARYIIIYEGDIPTKIFFAGYSCD